MDRLLRDAGVEKPLQRLERVQVGVAEQLLVGVRARQPERLALPDEEIDRQVDLLGEVARGVLRLAAQGELDREEGQVAALDGALQLVQLDALVVQLLQQLEPRLALVPLDALEQPLGLEVDLRDG